MNRSARDYGKKTELKEDKPVYIDPSWRGVVKWGGLSLLVSGAIAVLFFVLVLATQQTLPVPAEEALENPLVPTALFTLTVIGEVLLLPSGLALYFPLEGVKKTPMFIATALWMLCVPMFLASRGQIIALSQISSRYLETTDATMRASYLASAELALEIQNLYATMGLILLSIASIIIGIVMLKGKEVFGKRIGYVVIGAGAFTLFGAITVITEVPIIVPVIGVILTAVWQFYIGFRLFRLAGETS
jgi:hypothetical protein